MDIRDIIKDKDLKTALNDLEAYVVGTFGKPSHFHHSATIRLYSYPKYDISFRVDMLTNDLLLNVQSYDCRVNNYIRSVGIVYDFREFKDAVEMLTEGDYERKV